MEKKETKRKTGKKGKRDGGAYGFPNAQEEGSQAKEMSEEGGALRKLESFKGNQVEGVQPNFNSRITPKRKLHERRDRRKRGLTRKEGLPATEKSPTISQIYKISK